MLNRPLNRMLDRALAAVAGGKIDALATVYDEMARKIYTLACGMTGNTHDAEDVLGDTMLAIARDAAQYHLGGNPQAWILTLARHRALDLLRRRKMLPLDDELELADDGGLASLEAMDLLRPLDDEEKQIVLLHLNTGLRHHEIAEIMGLSCAAVQKRYRRALEKCKATSEYGGKTHEKA